MMFQNNVHRQEALTITMQPIRLCPHPKMRSIRLPTRPSRYTAVPTRLACNSQFFSPTHDVKQPPPSYLPDRKHEVVLAFPHQLVYLSRPRDVEMAARRLFHHFRWDVTDLSSRVANESKGFKQQPSEVGRGRMKTCGWSAASCSAQPVTEKKKKKTSLEKIVFTANQDVVLAGHLFPTLHLNIKFTREK